MNSVSKVMKRRSWSAMPRFFTSLAGRNESMCTACRYIGSAKERTAWKSSSWMERSQRVMIPSLMLSAQVCGSGVSRGDLRRLAAKSPASSHSPVIRNRATIDRIRPILMAIRTTELFISLPVPFRERSNKVWNTSLKEAICASVKRSEITPSFWISLK